MVESFLPHAPSNRRAPGDVTRVAPPLLRFFGVHVPCSEREEAAITNARHGHNAVMMMRTMAALAPLFVIACSASEDPQQDANRSSASGATNATVTNTTAGLGTQGSSSTTMTSAAPSSITTGQGTSAATLTSSSNSANTASSVGTSATSSSAASTTGGGGAEGTASASSGAGGPDGTSSTGSVSPANCTASTLENGDDERTVDVSGVSRSYTLHVPAGYDGTTPVPLVFDYHGLGGSGMQQAQSSGYRQVADREGFLIAFPNGTENAWNIGQCCTNSKDVDDVAFTRAMIESIAADGCVDLKRVYVTGFSNGGGMSYLMACEAADVIAAAAPAAFDMLDPEDPPCVPSRPIAVLSSRGTNDTAVPYGGGRGSGNRVTFLGAEQSLARWSEINGCSATTTEADGCVFHTECDAGVEVGLCTIQGGGHAPGDADTGWAFLSQFSLP